MRLQQLARTAARLVFGCRHPQAYRARRALYGYEVLHYVCPDCGHSAPMVQRTEAEYRALFDPVRRANDS